MTAKASARNSRTRRNLRDALKAFSRAIEDKKPDKIAKAQANAIRAIDVAAKKAVIHRNKAARYKSQISAQAKAAGVKQVKRVKSQTKSPPATATKAKKNEPAKSTPKK